MFGIVGIKEVRIMFRMMFRIFIGLCQPPPVAYIEYSGFMLSPMDPINVLLSQAIYQFRYRASL